MKLRLGELQLHMHLLVCKTCAKFSKKNTQLTSLCDQANLQGLSEKEKAEMKRKLQN